VSGGAATHAGRLRLPRRLPGVGRRAGALAASPRLRRRLVVLAAACLLLAAGYQFWLRDSWLVAVERVTVTGLTTSDAERLRAALSGAGRMMTTLHVDQDALERAVAGFPVVRELEVTPDFPHGLRIHVVEHVPAAVAVGDGGRAAVAADGTILHGVRLDKGLPTVEVDGAVGVEQLRDRTALASAAIAGAVPAALEGRIAEVGEDGELGQVARLRKGPELIFGDATRVRAKWAAAARVLADLEASGASYVDLRIPGRPAVGGLEAETITPVAPAGSTSTIPPASGGATEATVDPAVAGTVPPVGGTVTAPPVDGTVTVPPVDGTVSPETTPPPPGTVTQTGAAAPAAPTAPAATVPSGTAGGATASPSP
jgi:cell division protein FtsQ